MSLASDCVVACREDALCLHSFHLHAGVASRSSLNQKDKLASVSCRFKVKTLVSFEKKGTQVCSQQEVV